MRISDWSSDVLLFRSSKPFGVNPITMHPQIFDLIDVCARHEVGHVVLAGGLPPKRSIEAIKARGATVTCFAPAFSLAKHLVSSEERRVGNAYVSPSSALWWQNH